MQLVKSKL